MLHSCAVGPSASWYLNFNCSEIQYWYWKVQRVQFRKIDREHQERFAVLLSVAYDSGVVIVRFSGDGAVRLEVSELLCALSDFDEVWPTVWRPEHQTP